MGLKHSTRLVERGRRRSKSAKKLILLLSSGQRPRYRDDIIRALALPAGARLQFRYDERHVVQAFVGEKTRKSLVDREVLIGYLDTGGTDGDMEIVPCRFGRLLEVQAEGNFLVIHFEIRGYAGRETGCVLERKDIVGGGRLPFRKEGKREAAGEFCHLVEREPGGFRNKGSELEFWQRIVADLDGRPEFSNCPFFYTVRGVFESGKTERKVQPSKGEYVLKPDRLHEIKMVHYGTSLNDDQQYGENAIIVELKGNGIQRLTSQHPLIDSRYDLKTSYFRTLGTIEDQYGVLSLSRKVGTNEHQDFEMTVKVKRAWVRPALIVLLIGASVAIPRLIELLPIDCCRDWQTIGAYLVAGVVAGTLVVFGLRKMP